MRFLLGAKEVDRVRSLCYAHRLSVPVRSARRRRDDDRGARCRVSQSETPVLLFCLDHDPPLAMLECRALHKALQTLKVPTELIVQPRPMTNSYGIARTRSLLELMRRTLALGSSAGTRQASRRGQARPRDHRIG